MRDNFEDGRVPAQKNPSFGPEVMLKMMLIFEQVCADNNISRASTELRGTLALAIIRAGARSHDLADLKNAAAAAIEHAHSSSLAMNDVSQVNNRYNYRLYSPRP